MTDDEFVKSFVQEMGRTAPQYEFLYSKVFGASAFFVIADCNQRYAWCQFVCEQARSRAMSDLVSIHIMWLPGRISQCRRLGEIPAAMARANVRAEVIDSVRKELL
jgi:hypothetical protein